MPNSARFLPFKGGGPSEFRISRILTCKLHNSLILHPNDPISVLKWLVGIFLQKWVKKLWPLFFGFGESPFPPIFFRKSVHTFKNSDFIFQNFWKNLKTCVRRLAWANLCGSEILNFVFFYQNFDFLSKSVWSRFIFGYSKKYICYICAEKVPKYQGFWDKFVIRIFFKSVWSLFLPGIATCRTFRIFKITKQGEKNLISEIVRNHSHGNFKPSYG